MNRINIIEDFSAINIQTKLAKGVDSITIAVKGIKKLLLLTSCLLVLFFVSTAQSKNGSSVNLTDITVAKDGSGNFKSIQEAVDAVRAYSPFHITVKIKNGVYKEKIVVPTWVVNISFVGESKEGTIITNDDYSGKFINKDTLNDKRKYSTFTSYTMQVQGNDVSIENLTIQNTAGRVGQAVALHVDGDRFVIKNCNLLGNQDTLLTANDMSRQYYESCFIEGTTDFIFGNATCIFNNCIIKSLTNSFVTAASTSQKQKFGYVFMHCKLIGNNEAKDVFLGRPWRAYSRVVFMYCELGKHIKPEGWNNWSKTENETTAYYAEYMNVGEGSNTSQRAKWTHTLSKKEAKKYTIENIFKDWKP